MKRQLIILLFLCLGASSLRAQDTTAVRVVAHHRAYLDLQDGLSHVIEFCADVAAQIVITLVQMKDGMYVDIVLAAPSHQQANHFCSLS